MSISETIKNRIISKADSQKKENKKQDFKEGDARYIEPFSVEEETNKPISYFSTENISEFIEEGELELLVDEVTEQMEGVLRSLVIDTESDHNTKDTARRVAKMFILETFNGRYVPQPKATTFPNVTKYDQIYIVGPIEIKSTCAHHFQNIVGKCWIGVKPGKDVIGLSKFNRVVDWLARRPSIQEELSNQIADMAEEITQAEGIAVFMRAEHMCMTHRGVKAHESDMKTSVMRGIFLEDKSMKKEFFDMLAL